MITNTNEFENLNNFKNTKHTVSSEDFEDYEDNLDYITCLKKNYNENHLYEISSLKEGTEKDSNLTKHHSSSSPDTILSKMNLSKPIKSRFVEDTEYDVTKKCSRNDSGLFENINITKNDNDKSISNNSIYVNSNDSSLINTQDNNKVNANKPVNYIKNKESTESLLNKLNLNSNAFNFSKNEKINNNKKNSGSLPDNSTLNNTGISINSPIDNYSNMNNINCNYNQYPLNPQNQYNYQTQLNYSQYQLPPNYYYNSQYYPYLPLVNHNINSYNPYLTSPTTLYANNQIYNPVDCMKKDLNYYQYNNQVPQVNQATQFPNSNRFPNITNIHITNPIYSNPNILSNPLLNNNINNTKNCDKDSKTSYNNLSNTNNIGNIHENNNLVINFESERKNSYKQDISPITKGSLSNISSISNMASNVDMNISLTLKSSLHALDEMISKDSTELISFLQTKSGSRSFQNIILVLVENNQEFPQSLISKFLSFDFTELILSSYSSFFFEKTIKYLSSNQRQQLLTSPYFKMQFVNMCCGKYSNIVIQAFMKCLNKTNISKKDGKSYSDQEDKEEEIIKTLIFDNFDKFISSQYANFVLNQIFYCFKRKNKQFIYEYIHNNLFSLASSSQYGHYLIKNFIKYLDYDKKYYPKELLDNGFTMNESENEIIYHRNTLVNNVVKNIFFLTPHKFGHFVVIDIVEIWGIEVSKEIINLITDNVLNFWKVVYGYSIIKRIFVLYYQDKVSLY